MLLLFSIITYATSQNYILHLFIYLFICLTENTEKIAKCIGQKKPHNLWPTVAHPRKPLQIVCIIVNNGTLEMYVAVT